MRSGFALKPLKYANLRGKMPLYSRRERSSSSSSSSSRKHSPAPKHRSRSPARNSGSNRYPSSTRRDNSRRRSRSFSPRRRQSSPRRRRTPPRRDSQRDRYQSRRSPSPRRRSPKSSPSRRRSKSPGYRRKSRSPFNKSRRSPSPRSRYHGSSPSRSSRRSPPRTRSPPRESSTSRPAESASKQSSTYPVESPASSTALPELPSTSVTRAVLETEPTKQEWIPGLDIAPEPIPVPATTTVTMIKTELLNPRDKPVETTYTSVTRDLYPSSSSREHDVSSSTRHSSTADISRGRERSRTPPAYTSSSQSRAHAESSRSPVGRRLEAERDFNWVHPKIDSSRPALDAVRVSVNLPADDIDLRSRDRSTTAPWERKRQEQEQRSQREAEEQRERERAQALAAEQERQRLEAEARARAEQKAADTQRYFPPSSASTLGTRGSLSSRFGTGTEYEQKFKPKENITVGIQRNLKDADERAPIRRHFTETEVVLPRRKEEGEVALSTREEFKTREEEIEERRIIKVVKNEDEKPSSYREVKRENFEVRREHLTKPLLSDRWKERDSRVVQSSSHRRSPTPEKKESSYRPSEDVRKVDKVRDERNVLHRTRDREDDRKRSPVRVERRISESHRLSKDQTEFRGRINKRGRFEIDPSDLRHNLATKRKTEKDRGDRDRSQERGNVRSRIGDKESTRERRSERPGERPDFSRREDKYAYEEWKDKPEMIPKGSSYFEHDNRDTYVPRGRGRGGRGSFRGAGRGRGRGGNYFGTSFRGRGRGRGRGNAYRGFGKRTGADGDREWKHDKFKEVEEPTSTTEK